MHNLEAQRIAMLTALGPEYDILGFNDLMFVYLGSLGFLQPSLLSRLEAWGVANNVPQTLTLTSVGLTP